MRSLVVEEDLKLILSDTNIDWHAFAGKTVLVSGANGFLPAYMVEALLYANETLLQKKAHIICLVRNAAKAATRFTFYKNRNDISFLEQDVSAHVTFAGNIDYIIHAASPASPRQFFSDPVGTINANTLGSENLLRLGQSKGIAGFLYFSSCEVYGNIFDARNMASETDFGAIDPASVRSCYGIAKKAGEALCAAYFHQYGVPAKMVRPSHTYGPGFSFDDGRVFASFVASVIRNENIVLKSDGKAKRSFLYLSDATRAYFTVLLKGQNGMAHNVGNEYEISMIELARTIIDASGNHTLKLEFNPDKTPNISSAAMHGLLCIKRMRELGWNPTVREKQGFERTISYYRQGGERR